MDSSYYFLMFILIFGGLAVVSYFSFILIKDKHEKNVIQKSKKLNAIYDLNGKTIFFPIPQSESLVKNCTSKREFDATIQYQFLGTCIYMNIEKYRQWINGARKNADIYKNYLSEYNRIFSSEFPEDVSNYGNFYYFKRVEERLCKSALKTAITTPEIFVTIVYRSPQGRNFYKKDACFKFEHICEKLDEVEKLMFNNQTSQFEREKMTDSLRYDILKRDNFRCTICGAKASDGVMLHVDHIFPVSKGGKTEWNNLRTLCERCNMGKGAKYDKNGIN